MSREVAEYADWYKAGEQPQLSDDAFHNTDDYTLALEDFRARFDGAVGITN